MGDRYNNCKRGFDFLEKGGNVRIEKYSGTYRTEPVDYKDQDWFVNLVVQAKTGLAPDKLLKRLKEIEKEVGRTDTGIRFGPRILDLDILLFDEQILETSVLVIPHPRMHLRRFVLQPLCDIDPGLVHPVLNKNMTELLGHLKRDGQKVELLS